MSPRGSAWLPAEPPTWWRSLLFVPADQERLLRSCASRGADAVILDLEDSVTETDKLAACRSAADAIGGLAAAGQEVVVRINSDWRTANRDLEAVVRPGLRAIMVPKAERPATLKVIAEMLGEFEGERGMSRGAVGLIALVETPRALSKLARIAAAPRMIGVALGPEDIAASLGVAPSASVLDLPCQLVAQAAASRRLMALGAPISIAAYADLAGFDQGLQRARAVGMTGALCIHPGQVTAANEAFAPSASEVEEANAILEAWMTRGAGGVARLEGRMIDPPVVRRAERVLRLARAGTSC